MIESTIQLLTALASLIAVFVGLGTLVFQYKSFNKQRKPVIRVLRKEFHEKLLPKYFSEWESNKKIDPVYSESYLTVANYGGSAAHIENYSYNFLNRKTLEKKFKSIETDNDALLIENGEEEYEFNITIKQDGISYRQRCFESVLGNGKMINSGEEILIPLPSFFMVLSNYLMDTDAPVPLPVLKIFVRYSDLDSSFREQEFKVSWDSNKTRKATARGTILTASLSIELIKEERIKRDKTKK